MPCHVHIITNTNPSPNHSLPPPSEHSICIRDHSRVAEDLLRSSGEVQCITGQYDFPNLQYFPYRSWPVPELALTVEIWNEFNKGGFQTVNIIPVNWGYRMTWAKSSTECHTRTVLHADVRKRVQPWHRLYFSWHRTVRFRAAWSSRRTICQSSLKAFIAQQYCSVQFFLSCFLREKINQQHFLHFSTEEISYFIFSILHSRSWSTVLSTVLPDAAELQYSSRHWLELLRMYSLPAQKRERREAVKVEGKSLRTVETWEHTEVD